MYSITNDDYNETNESIELEPNVENLHNESKKKVFLSMQLDGKGKIHRKYNKKRSNSISFEEDDFQVINNEDYNIKCSRSLSDEIFKQKNLIRESVVMEDNNKNTSIWDSLTLKISNITNNLKYNIITTNSYVKFDSLKYIRMFDEVFLNDYVKNEDYMKKKIFQMTYRSEFTPIVFENKIFKSDCGWGCMVRAAQMMLSKTILENKIYEYYLKHDTDKINDKDLQILKIETLLLFFDNNLKIEDVVDNKDFEHFNSQLGSIADEEEKNEKINKLKGDKILNNFEYLNDENTGNSLSYILEVTPPFSIQNICRMGIYFNKHPGMWFSDVLMINIFLEINKQFNAIRNMELIHFKEGVVDEGVLLEKCFKKLNCFDTCPQKINNGMIQQEDICDNCSDMHFLTNPHGIIQRENDLYEFIKRGTIFVSVRHGLDQIEKDYINSVSQIFEIPNNLGIIGGKTNSALYFIGETSHNLIYLDPHINQKAVKDKAMLEFDISSFFPKYLYKIDIKNISPAFTTGFYFRSAEEYKNLLEGFEHHNKIFCPIFKFKKYIKNTNYSIDNIKLSNKNLKVIDEMDAEDDYCVIDYEDE